MVLQSTNSDLQWYLPTCVQIVSSGGLHVVSTGLHVVWSSVISRGLLVSSSLQLVSSSLCVLCMIPRCVRACVRVCMRACVHVHPYVYACVRACACACACAYACTCVYMCVQYQKLGRGILVDPACHTMPGRTSQCHGHYHNARSLI